MGRIYWYLYDDKVYFKFSFFLKISFKKILNLIFCGGKYECMFESI